MAHVAIPAGDLEYKVLRTIVDAGEVSIRDVYDAIGAPQGLVYTTIAKVVDRLLAKRLLSRRTRAGAYLYSARLSGEKLERRRATDMLRRLLGNEPQPAIASLVDAVEDIDPDLLDELARLVSARRRARRGA
jgi:predicted transcriptional regulator